MTTIVAVADGIFEIRDGKPILLGSRCTNCDNHMFPRQTGCPRCLFNEQEDVELATKRHAVDVDGPGFSAEGARRISGRSATTSSPTASVTSNCPASSASRVGSRSPTPSNCRSGWRWNSCSTRSRIDDDGNQVVTYAFAPVENGDQS